ncbi:MAG: hypothetical protein HUJ52_03965 [Malacoplasma sp.]|nr:hypothetical protein [Malacoplasma sp.]
MAKMFRIKVYTPSGILFEDDITQAQVLASDGWIGFLPDHAPLIGSFNASHFYIYDSQRNKVDTVVGSGIFQFNCNEFNVFTDFFAFAKSIDENVFAQREKQLNDVLARQDALGQDKTYSAITIQLKKHLNDLKKVSAKK